ncbi:septation protein A [Sphingomonas mesophila]|uniref:septation protein A n=1 Tax=Sphingomonas mesophila TaxID=2303576 RepID=UPI000E593029|nr:septation protein A [Sphingomonas mesophila]
MSKARAEPTGGIRLLVDIGPLLVFFLVNFLVDSPAKIFIATGAFMAAMVAAMVFTQLKYGKISPLLLFSGVMVLALGGLTLWLHDELFIKIKPTIYYLFVAALLGFGLKTGRNYLKMVLGSAYPGLDEAGWSMLARNWALFFVFMAALNETVWRTTSFDFWVGFKLWGAIPLTFLFAAANVPMLLRHGLANDEQAAQEPGPIE